MQRRLLMMTVGLWLTLASAARADEPVRRLDREATCGKHGTSVEFVGSPSEAARLAKKAEKLVFVLHVSGHFEDPRFT
jgi:hypothetical protein